MRSCVQSNFCIQELNPIYTSPVHLKACNNTLVRPTAVGPRTALDEASGLFVTARRDLSELFH